MCIFGLERRREGRKNDCIDDAEVVKSSGTKALGMLSPLEVEWKFFFFFLVRSLSPLCSRIDAHSEKSSNVKGNKHGKKCCEFN